MPVFASNENSVLTARTGHYTPLPFGCSPLTRPLEVRDLLQPPASQTSLHEIPHDALRKDVFCSWFHGSFWIFQIDFGEPIVLTVGTQTQSVFRLTCCMAFLTWTSLWILPVMRPGWRRIGMLWRATLMTWNLKKQINRNLGRVRLLLLASSWQIYCHVFFGDVMSLRCYSLSFVSHETPGIHTWPVCHWSVWRCQQLKFRWL